MLFIVLTEKLASQIQVKHLWSKTFDISQTSGFECGAVYCVCSVQHVSAKHSYCKHLQTDFREVFWNQFVGHTHNAQIGRAPSKF